MLSSFLEKTDTNVKENNIKSKIEERVTATEVVCNKLFETTVGFEREAVYQELRDYIEKYDRIFYSIISQYIFHKANDKAKFAIVNQNIDTLYGHIQDLKKKNVDEDKTDEYDHMERVILKIYDHVNLAYKQLDELKDSDDEFERKFKINAAPFQEKFSREMSMQLLTMISIFTALAFLMFGGISSLGSIFSNHELPILKVMIIGSVWGLCILNVVFVFLFCVGKMTKIGIASNIKNKNEEKEESDSNIIHKYIVVWWSDLIILTVLAISVWTYYIRENELDSWFATFCHNHLFITTTLGYLIIIAIFVGITFFLFCQRKK